MFWTVLSSHEEGKKYNKRQFLGVYPKSPRSKIQMRSKSLSKNIPFPSWKPIFSHSFSPPFYVGTSVSFSGLKKSYFQGKNKFCD
jgi:hypothetical protein